MGVPVIDTAPLQQVLEQVGQGLAVVGPDLTLRLWNRSYSDLLGLPAPSEFGPFQVVQVSNGVSLDFMDSDEVHPQHYAFLLSEGEFDEVFGRIREQRLTYWADPGHQRQGAGRREGQDPGRQCQQGQQRFLGGHDRPNQAQTLNVPIDILPTEY